MPDPASVIVAAGGALTLGGGVAAQLRARRLRQHWRSAGLGLEERSTGLSSIVAAPVVFPGELETACAADMQLAVLVLRRFTVHPETFGRALAGVTRSHEVGWRIDYDVFAVTLMVRSRDDAVLAAARIGRASCAGSTPADLRAGIALCPDDADDLLDAVDVGLRRLRGFHLVEAVAGQIQATRRGPTAVQSA